MKRTQPYRLAWPAQPKLPDTVNAVLARQFSNADQMFDILFRDFGNPSATPTPALLLKLPSAPLLVTPEIGALEFVDDGTTGHLYITVSIAGVATRVQIV
jgi:hypothetical protein